MKCFIATSNPGKLVEIKEMLASYLPHLSEVAGRAPENAPETERTFLGNARIKAWALTKELEGEGLRSFAVLADDSGLSVDALGGAPGVHSARYAGDHVKPEAHIKKLLEELNRVSALQLSQRSGRYHCALVLIEKSNEGLKEYFGEGNCEGQIAFEARGQSGFGYDPIFYLPEKKVQMAELSYQEKNAFSHRTRAFEALAKARFQQQT